jgi:hypothetical protein
MSSSRGRGLQQWSAKHEFKTQDFENVTHCHNVHVGFGTSLVIIIEFGHPSVERWDKRLVTSLAGRPLPICEQPLKRRKRMLQCRRRDCRERLLGIVCVLSQAATIRQ